jgi:hypothetical protein
MNPSKERRFAVCKNVKTKIHCAAIGANRAPLHYRDISIDLPEADAIKYALVIIELESL